MSRRRKVYKKEEKLDSRYGSAAVARLISTVMKRGTRPTARATRSRSAMTLTRWRRQIAPLHISAGNEFPHGYCDLRKTEIVESEFAEPRIPARADAQHRHRRAY